MSDLATLGLQIDARQVKAGVGELDKLTDAGARAEGGTKKVTTATQALQSSLTAAIDALNRNTAASTALQATNERAAAAMVRVSKSATEQAAALASASHAATALAASETQATTAATQLATTTNVVATSQARATATAKQLFAASSMSAASMRDLTSHSSQAGKAAINLAGSTAQTTSAVKLANKEATALTVSTHQMAAVATVASTEVKALGAATGLSRMQALEFGHVIRSVTDSVVAGGNPIKALAMESGRIGQIMSQSGTGIKGFIGALAQMSGIIKVTTDAELAAEAASAGVAASAISGAAARAASNIIAADTQMALARAEIATATTSEALTAAQASLAAAHTAVAGAAREAQIAEQALSLAQGRAATTSAASAAATRVGIGATAGVLTGLAVAAGIAFGAFKAFQSKVGETHELDNYARSLGLTKKEFKELTQEVGGLTSKEMKDLDNRLLAFQVTWGDVFSGLRKTAADALNLSSVWQKFKADAANAFASALQSAVKYAAYVSAIMTTNVGPGYWDNVVKNAAKAQEQASKSIKTVRDNILGAARDRIRSAADTIIEDRTPKKAKKASDHGLADSLARLDAEIKGQLALAAAYRISDAAVMQAEAHQKAEEDAIKHKSEIGIFYEKELAKAVATRIATGEREAADMRFEADARGKINDMVAAGLITSTQAGQALALETKLRPLAAAAANAHGEALVKANQAIADVTAGQAKLNDETNRAQILADTAKGNEQLDRLRLEASLIGASNVERAKAIAFLEADQYLKAHPGGTANTSDEQVVALTHVREYLQTQKGIAQATADLTTAQNNYNNSLSYMADLLGVINEQAQTTAGALSNAFGSVGAGVGQALTALTSYGATQAKLDQDHRAALKAAGADSAAAARVDILYTKQSATAKQQAILGAIGGIKSLFKEHSTAYKIMSGIEKAYAAFQAAETIVSIARDFLKTGTHLANSGVRTSANVTEGGSKIFADLGPWAFPVVAAMIAVMVGLGFGGGGGGSSGPSIPTADDIQANAGTGSILGDAKAKSESIAHSLEIVAANTNKDLEYSNQMLMALHSIDTSIAKLAGTVAQQIKVAGSLFDTKGLNLGQSGSGGFLGIGAKSTTRSLYDLGLNLNSGTVADIIAGGVSGSSYQTVEQIKKKSGFFGIGGSTRTSYQTTSGSIDPSITSAIQDVVTSLRDGLVSAAKVVGLDGAAALLDGFNVSLGQISFKDMTGQQIEDQLNAIFSKVGDDMAGAIFPALTGMQKVGEGLFETFMRVAREYQVVDVALQTIGKTFGAVGVSSLAARDNLVQLFGSLDEFVSATSFFAEQFMSDAERIAPIQASVSAELARLGMAGLTTRDQFKQAVLGLDLTTQAGRDLYAGLLAVAPGFDKVLDYFDQANKAMASTLKSTADQFNGFVTSLTKYRDSLFAGDSATASYEQLRAKFGAVSTLAATGDATALGGLEASGKAFLDSAKDNAATLVDYQRDIALVAQGVDKGIFAAESVADYSQLQLDALNNATSILQTIATNTAPLLTVPAGAAPAVTTSAPSPTDAQMVDQNATIIQQNATIISLLTSQGALWTRAAGDGLLIRTDADTPISTKVVV